MGIANNQLLDLRKWEFLGKVGVETNYGMADGRFMVPSNHVIQQAMYVAALSNQSLYRPAFDSYALTPSIGGGSNGAGNGGAASAWSTGSTAAVSSLTATAGTVSTITTNQTLKRNLAGWPIHIMSGPNAGVTLTITSNTLGTNAVITVPTQGVAFSASTTYRLGTPRFYIGMWTASTTTNGWRAYDWATDSWVSLSTTGFPSTFGTDCRIVTTPSWINTGHLQFATGTATSATGTTLVNSSKSWTSGQWVNYQIRIVSGTGAGQIRTITASDATSVTVATWTTTPDSTSTYSIEGNDDFIYVMGNSAVTLYRYSISGNSWTTLSPSVARSSAMLVHGSGNWISQADHPTWQNESSIINGRRIYSWRGGGSAFLDYYDIPSNAWTNSLSYAPNNMSWSNNRQHAAIGGDIYMLHSSSSGDVRWYKYDCVRNELTGWGITPPTTYSATSSLLTSQTGNSTFPVFYTDSSTGTVIPYIYSVYPTGQVTFMTRTRVF